MTAPYTQVLPSMSTHGFARWITWQEGQTFCIMHIPGNGLDPDAEQWSVMVRQPDGQYAEHPRWPWREVGRFLRHYRLALYDTYGKLVR